MRRRHVHHIKPNTAPRAFALIVALALLTAGCTKPAYVGVSDMPRQVDTRVILSPGDVIDVKFFSAPELNESQTIRPDGRIALQLVGEVTVAGKEPSEVGTDLARLYTPHLKNPEVTVIVRSFEGRRVFVGGEVRSPGMVSMPGPMSALEAIMYAGGFDPLTAAPKNVVVIRHANGQRYGAAIDMRPALAGAVTDQFYLEPQDIVFVPRMKIVKVAQWIDQHINQIIPMFGVEYFHRIDEDNAVTIDLTRSRRITR